MDIDGKQQKFLNSSFDKKIYEGGSFISKYLNHHEIKKLDLTKGEIEKYFVQIIRMVDEDELCSNSGDQCYFTDGIHFKIARDKQGKLIFISVPCAKMNVIRNWIYKPFDNELSQIRMNEKYIKNKDFNINKKEIKDTIMKQLKNDKLESFYISSIEYKNLSVFLLAFANEITIRNKLVSMIDANELYKIRKDAEKCPQTLNLLKESDVLFITNLKLVDDFNFFEEQIKELIKYFIDTNKVIIFSSDYKLNELQRIFSNKFKYRNESEVKSFFSLITSITKKIEFVYL